MESAASVKGIPGLQFCWLCGETDAWLQAAHIHAGAGTALRKDDRRAVCLLCDRCHRCHVSDSNKHTEMTINNETYPTIDAKVMLWLKLSMDSAYFDPDFLEGLWIGNLPEPKAPSQFWLNRLYENQGLML